MSISLPPVDSPRRSEFGLATPRLSPPLPLVAAAPLATVYASGCSTPRDDEEDPGSNEDTFDEVEMKFARPRPTIGRTSQGRPDNLQFESRYLSAYDTLYVAAEDGYECGGEQETCVLYLAMAMGSTRAVGSRSGHPLLSYECVLSLLFLPSSLLHRLIFPPSVLELEIVSMLSWKRLIRLKGERAGCSVESASREGWAGHGRNTFT